MKFSYSFFLVFMILYACSKTTAPSVVKKLSGCDSVTSNILKPNRNDSIRLSTCFILTSCDSIRLGLINKSNLNRNDSIRLSSCIILTGCDSVRLSLLKPSKSDSIRLSSCIILTSCDSLRFGLINKSSLSKNDSIRLSNCLIFSRKDSINLLLKIGDKFEGGIVFYFLKPGDLGYENSQKHGFISALFDIDSAQLGCQAIQIPNSNYNREIGTGKQNTLLMVSGCPEVNTIEKVCNKLKIDGYNDWFIPSKDELDLLYINRSVIGEFRNSLYWSSSDMGKFNGGYAVWAQAFGSNPNYPQINITSGDPIVYYRASGFPLFVRPIRSF